ncbi:MAG: AAA family ATPase [Dysgonamonadaceae bacterium]|jgi:exonuclease SbcC|nr:AAA family ATPase [Dysgonamonadaceae bacterium]
MKILSLGFKNINSLSGEWNIDFTEPRFIYNGLFAITGKTGAGKSSILDAISLALYGKTPRVEITGQNNDVMTRGTSDCFSEIIFEVGGKKWKSSWKQERTRTGNLKPVNRQIADSSDKIFADQTRACDAKIVEILGLTFEQFTKVIMLAQGSFAAFLQADKNGKGELLEQITGTEIYGEISKKVFERSKTEKEKLDKIVVEIEAIKLLPAEEVENLENEIKYLKTQKEQTDNELQAIETAKKWLADLENLQKQIYEAKQNLPELEQKNDTLKTAFEQSEMVLKTAKTEHEKVAPVLVKVRELSVKITENDKSLNLALQAIVNLEKNRKELSQTLENKKNNLAELQIALKEKENWINVNAKYGSLPEQFAAIENQNLQVEQLLNDSNTKKTELVSAEKDLNNKISVFNKSLTSFSEKDKALNDKKSELEAKKTELSLILSGKEMAYYLSEKENITGIGIKIKNLIELEKAIVENKNNVENYKKNIISSECLEKELLQKCLENKKEAKSLENQINLLDENIKLVKTIQSLDEHRKLLEDGEACPLCGALEHPFAQGNEPKIDGKEAELKKLKKQSNEITKTIQDNEKVLVKTVSDKENALKNKEKEENSLLENERKRNIVLLEIKQITPDFLISDSENNVKLLEEIHKQKQNDYKQITDIISKATENEKLIKNLQNEEIPLLQHAKQTAEKENIEAETAKKLAEQQVENRKYVLNEAEAKYKEKNAELLNSFAEYGVENITTLKKCLTDWNTNKNAIENLKEKLTELENSINLTNSEITNFQNLIKAKTDEKAIFETDKQKFTAERFELFGNKQVDDEENRLKYLLAKAETEKTKAEREKNEINTELAKNKAIIADKEKELKEKLKQNITDKSSEELQSECAEKKLMSEQFSQKTGANRQALDINDKNLKTGYNKLKHKELQQQIYNKWASLNELIGSADGKKYRNFAQTLTFEHLVDMANRQLQKMSERYILKRVGDAANPFELSVIDKFQNYDERVAQNLSGGEKFIVSLALALGLANMTSKNMKIDTMFIDEGFGTLDSDYLDLALSALSSLQNEGKLIGVISHLSELKERIATHIEVIPGGNGLSRIEIRN